MSQPPHFGDYGGLALKILRARSDILVILIGFKPVERKLFARHRQLRSLFIHVDPHCASRQPMSASRWMH